MIISVISPQKRTTGVTSIAALTSAALAKQSRKTLLINTAAHSQSLNLYFGIGNCDDAPATQLTNLVKMGGASKESIPEYCFSVNDFFDVFSIEDGNKDKQAINDVHEFLMTTASHNYIVCDVDTDMEDERTKKVLEMSDCVLLVLTPSIKNMKKFVEAKPVFAKMIRNKPVITVLNNFDPEVCSKEAAAAAVGITKKNVVSRWHTVHVNKYIPYCENRGKLELLIDQMGKRTSQTIMLDTDINSIARQIIHIQSEISKQRIAGKQASASITDSTGIHEGTILNYHQTQMNNTDHTAYLDGLDNLQYDILYGNRYCYDGKDKYPATDIVMGIDDVTVSETSDSIGGSEVFVYGNNFTKWSKVFVNDEKVNTTFSNSGCLIIPKDSVKDGDTIKVCQMGSNSTIFRESNTYTYKDPAVEETVTGTESDSNTESTVSESQK